jgi:hypothetical protein
VRKPARKRAFTLPEYILRFGTPPKGSPYRRSYEQTRVAKARRKAARKGARTRARAIEEEREILSYDARDLLAFFLLAKEEGKGSGASKLFQDWYAKKTELRERDRKGWKPRLRADLRTLGLPEHGQWSLQSFLLS